MVAALAGQGAAPGAVGAVYLLVIDTLLRSIAPTEVPLGIEVAVIGAPYFIWVLARGWRGWS